MLEASKLSSHAWPDGIVCIRVFSVFLLMSIVGISFFSTLTYGESNNANLFLTPTVYVAREIGEIFDMAINVSDIEDLYSCELTITYNTSLLDAVQVVQGGFFPQQTVFVSLTNESHGFVEVNMSLPEFHAPLSGNGTLARITFEVTQASAECIPPSIIKLNQTKLYNSDWEQISHNFVSAIYFWKSIQPDPPGSGGVLDLTTQQNGEGPDEPGGVFRGTEIVVLTSNVTYNDWPEQHSLVAFQAFNPLNETVFILMAETNEEGLARISFRIPPVQESLGYWMVISTVDVACEAVWDTLSFSVPSIIVGGQSFQIKGVAPENSLGTYLTLVIILSIAFTSVKRRKLN